MTATTVSAHQRGAPTTLSDADAARIPADIRTLLTTDQIAALTAALAPAPRRHRLAWRASTRVCGRHFYVAVLSGGETRSLRRITADGQRLSVSSLLVRIILTAAWITTTTLVLATAGVITVYLIKSYVGVDLMDGPSFLHQYFF